MSELDFFEQINTLEIENFSGIDKAGIEEFINKLKINLIGNEKKIMDDFQSFLKADMEYKLKKAQSDNAKNYQMSLLQSQTEYTNNKVRIDQAQSTFARGELNKAEIAEREAEAEYERLGDKLTNEYSKYTDKEFYDDKEFYEGLIEILEETTKEILQKESANISTGGGSGQIGGLIYKISYH